MLVWAGSEIPDGSAATTNTNQLPSEELVVINSNFPLGKTPLKLWGTFSNNVPRILNIEILPERSMKILLTLHAFF